MARPPLLLASASPRRHALLSAAGYRVTARATDVDEAPRPGEAPRALVARLARAKAEAAGAGPADIVVAADTTVALDDTILGKPVDDADAARMLRDLSGRSHHVYTGWCVRRGAVAIADVVVTTVTFRVLHDDDIAAYLRTGEHRDKAGAYGIQGAAAVLVDHVDGSLTNVIGLPVRQVVDAIAAVAGTP